MSGHNSEAISFLEFLSNTESKEGCFVSGEKVTSIGLDLAIPSLFLTKASKASSLQLLDAGFYNMELGGCFPQEFNKTSGRHNKKIIMSFYWVNRK